jgi:adenine-specific DNA-methyltransferase
MWEQPKLMIPYMITELSAFFDRSEQFYFINVTTGGYGITTNETRCTLPILCALLNSNVLDFCLKRISSNFQGGYFPANKQFIEQLPIARVDSDRAKTLSSCSELIAATRAHLADHPETASTRDPLMVAYWEQVLNGLVYELYFREELHAAGLRLFDLVAQAALPGLPSEAPEERRGDLTQLSDPARLKALRTKFEELYDIEHPLRAALFTLGNLETIRIIEGKE